MYFSGMKIDPINTCFCMRFSEFVRHVLSKICQYDQKHTLLFPGMKIDPIRVFACVFLNLSAMSFPKFVNMTKKPHPFVFRYENRPYKYVFLHAFFLICPPCHFQNFSIWLKTHPFFPILHVFALLNDIRAYIAWSWKTTLITFFFEDDIQLQIQVSPPQGHASRVTKRPYPDGRPMQ